MGAPAGHAFGCAYPPSWRAAVVAAGRGAGSADGRADGIGYRHPGRAPELCASVRTLRVTGTVRAHTLAAAAIIGWLGLGPFAACTGRGHTVGTDHGTQDRRDENLRAQLVHSDRPPSHGWRQPMPSVRSCRAAVVPDGSGRASGPTRAVTGSRVERFLTSTSACAIRGPRISSSGACREWRAFAQPPSRRGSGRV